MLKGRTGFTEESTANLSTHSIDCLVFLVDWISSTVHFPLEHVWGSKPGLLLWSPPDSPTGTDSSQLPAPSLGSVDSLPRPWRLQERGGDVICWLQPKSGLGWRKLCFGRSFTGKYPFPLHPYPGFVPSVGRRSCEGGDEEEHLKYLFLLPLIPLCPCNLFLLPDLLFVAPFSIPNTFSSLLFS